MGDVVALVANPIARALGLDKTKCGCARRQDALNRAFPFKPSGDSPIPKSG